MRQPIDKRMNLIGLVLWGDLGPITMYKNHRNQMVAFLKTYPDRQASQAQAYYRDQLTIAAAEWRGLTAQQKADWQRAASKLSLHCTGYGLFIHARMGHDPAVVTTVERQSGISLYQPPPP